MCRKFGTLDTIQLTPDDIAAVKNGRIRVVDDKFGNIRIGMRIGDEKPFIAPRLVVP